MGSESQEAQKNHLTNADVIRMVKGGFGDSIIINAIQTRETLFDVSLNALFQLKNAGVSQKIIEVRWSSNLDKTRQIEPISDLDRKDAV